MEGINGFSFAAPWALTVLLLLPLLWYLLRTLPPKPKVIRFPAVRLLQELSSERMLASKTPWWIVLIRAALAICLILALAGPMLNAPDQHGTDTRPHIIIIDNDWSVMDRWEVRKTELKNLLTPREQSTQPTFLITSTEPKKIHALPYSQLLYASENIQPQPWVSDYANLVKQVRSIGSQLENTPQISWIASGLTNTEQEKALNEINQLGDLQIIAENRANIAPLLSGVIRRDNGFQVNLSHIGPAPHPGETVQILDEDANVLAQYPIRGETAVFLDIPQELKSRAHSVRIAGYITPVAQFLLDEKWRDQNVGIISAKGKDKALLAPAYYVKKALQPYTSIQEGSIESLLARSFGLIFDVAHSTFSEPHQEQLTNWIEKGGIFVRFASAHHAQDAQRAFDPLLPVQLMPGHRSFGGSLSWKAPDTLAPFSENSPFFGLEASQDITIKKQVLARPEANLNNKIWARLQDGTPLITALAMEKGWSILFHIEAVPGWSDLPLSGTFEQMMKRLISLGSAQDAINAQSLLAPYRLFDHNGLLSIPNRQIQSIKLQALQTQPPSRLHPPGFYGQEQSLKAYNLGPFVSDYSVITDWANEVQKRDFQRDQVQYLTPWFLLAALLLSLLDWTLALRLKSLAKLGGATIIVLLCYIPLSHSETTDWSKALAAANQMRLAYIESGDTELDDTVKRGLNGLGMILRRRTAVELAPAMPFDPEKDDPSLFPMIYWALNDTPQSLSSEASDRLNRFLKTGGFILFDTMGQDRPQQLAQVTRGLDIAQLSTVNQDHVLTRSFYLMKRFPGRFDFDDIWVESDEDTKNDRVSSVLIGSNAWAQAWARDNNMRPLYPVVPGGEPQREQALRFGINLVMYVLSGNYKGDQVHIPAILQRLGL